MTLRPATADDEALFFMWRQQAENEGRAGGWWEGQLTTRAEHHFWYAARLDAVLLLVWERNGEEAGVVRIDTNGEVAFHANPVDAPFLLGELKPYARDYGGRLKVTVDHGNRAATKALKAAGYKEAPVRFFTYRR